jgi:signal transduction histidine kinase
VVFAIAKDVTERKMAEQQIENKYKKFKSLARHFKSSLEKERKYLGIELHEELAQLASVVKMDLDWIRMQHPEWQGDHRSRIDHAVSVSELLINSIRRISYAISPSMLEEMGLNETLNWLCGEFALLNGIPCLYQSTVDDEMIAHDIRLDLFRICQQALTHLMYNTTASTVQVQLHLADDRLQLMIDDDAKTLATEFDHNYESVVEMRERAASINGDLSIQHDPGKGTRVCFTLSAQLTDSE